MKVTHLSFDKNDNLVIKGINEKGKEELTYIAIPPTEYPRLDIISTIIIKEGYNFDCGENLIIIRVSNFGNEFIKTPPGVNTPV